MSSLRKKPYGLIVFSLTLMSCAGHTQDLQSGKAIVEPIYQSQQCGNLEAGLHLLQEQSEFDDIMNSSGVILLNNEPREIPQADFQNHNIVALSEGVRNTGGYGLRFLKDQSTLANNSVQLSIQRLSPGTNPVPQMITNPCLVLSLEKGAYSEIETLGYSLKGF